MSYRNDFDPEEQPFLDVAGPQSRRQRSSKTGSSYLDEPSSLDTTSGANTATTYIRPKGTVPIVKFMDEQVRHQFAKWTLLQTAISYSICASVMICFKQLVRREVAHTPASTAYHEFPLTENDEDFLRDMSRIFMLNLTPGLVDHNYVQKLRSLENFAWWFSMGSCIFGAVAAVPLYLYLRYAGREVMRSKAWSYVLLFTFALLAGLVVQALCFANAYTDIHYALACLSVHLWLIFLLTFCCFDMTACGLWLFVISVTMVELIVIAGFPLFATGVRYNWPLVIVNGVMLVMLTVHAVRYFQTIIAGRHRTVLFEVQDTRLAALLVFAYVPEAFVLFFQDTGRCFANSRCCRKRGAGGGSSKNVDGDLGMHNEPAQYGLPAPRSRYMA